MPNRNIPSSNNYRFGFNGKEKDDNIDNVAGSSLDFGSRLYDSRLGRWLSVDPLANKFPFSSDYAFANNDPIELIDKAGKEPNRAQAASLDAVFANIRANVKGTNGVVTIHDIYMYLKDHDKNVDGTPVLRYVYTKDAGWLDMNHIFSVLENGKFATDQLEPASGNALARKLLFHGAGAKSYYSYEDLPTNAFAATLTTTGTTPANMDEPAQTYQLTVRLYLILFKNKWRKRAHKCQKRHLIGNKSQQIEIVMCYLTGRVALKN